MPTQHAPDGGDSAPRKAFSPPEVFIPSQALSNALPPLVMQAVGKQKMRVLIGCEESATVREAFAKLGHDAWSCDLLPSRIPGKHIQADILTVLNDGWDLAIFHTPCTYLSNSGARWLYNKDGSRNQKRWELMERDALLFKATMEANIPMKANENPIMHKYAVEIIGRRQDQVIQPSMFGHTQSKATCLWLQNLPPLVATNDVSEIMKTMSKKETQRIHYMPPSPDRQRERSVTFPGIAHAMAQQWGSLAFQQSVYLTAFGVGMRPVNSLLGNIQAEVSPATNGGK